MNIGMVFADKKAFPPDIRVEKEIAALSKAGHEITVLAQRIPDSAKSEEQLPWYNSLVVRIPIENSTGIIRKALDLLTMQKRQWNEPLHIFFNEKKPDVLHVHDFIIVPTVIKIARKYNIPVVADLHENMPAAMRAYRADHKFSQRMLSTIVHNYHLMRWHEANTLKQCSKIIVVVPEAAERLLKYGIENEKIVIVSNTEDESTFPFKSEDCDQNITSQYQSYWVASYIGGIGAHRGLDTAIKAVPFIKDKVRNFILLIVGANEKDRKRIESMARELNIENFIQVIGWQTFHKVNSYIMSSNVCLVPHNNFEHTQTTVPHKLFQYMICGKPVIVSSCRPLKRIVEETRAGLVFEANDSRDLAAKILFSYEHEEEIGHMGVCGKKAALGVYAWRHDAKRLVSIYGEAQS